MISDEQIKDIFFTKNKKVKPQYKSLIAKYELNEYLNNRYNDSSSIIETLNRIFYNIEERPVCKQCGKPVKYYKSDVFSEFCSVKCAMNSDKIKQRCKEGVQAKYGVDNVYQSEIIKEKIRKTNLERYGYDSYLKTDEFKRRSSKTCLTKYGVNCTSKIPGRLEKVKKTNKDRRGVDWPMQSQDVRDKSIKTCIEKYGTNYYAQSNAFKNHFNDDEWVKNAKLKEYETKLKNNSFRISKAEKLLLEYLLELFPDTLYQYSIDKRYPFNCDFYIPSLDLFIEYNGFWTHQDHIFDPNDKNDIKLLKKWQDEYRRTGRRGGGIDTWTCRDPLKLKTAKEHNLNYLIIWGKDFNTTNKNYNFVKSEIEKFTKCTI